MTTPLLTLLVAAGKKSSNHRIHIDYSCYLTSFTLSLFIILGLLNWMTSLKKKVMMTTPLLRRQSFPVQVLTVQTALLGCRVAVVDIEINKSIQNPPVRLHQPMAESERPPWHPGVKGRHLDPQVGCPLQFLFQNWLIYYLEFNWYLYVFYRILSITNSYEI